MSVTYLADANVSSATIPVAVTSIAFLGALQRFHGDPFTEVGKSSDLRDGECEESSDDQYYVPHEVAGSCTKPAA